MVFSPLTLQVTLDFSSPEKLVSAAPGTYFYRVGNNSFYLVTDGEKTEVIVRKRDFAIPYKNEIWFYTIRSEDILFSKQYEVWIKKGTEYGNTGWEFVAYQKLLYGGTDPTPTVTPSITPTPTLTPSITPSTSVTPSITPTTSETPTPTPTPTQTPSVTPTLTPSSTPTYTPTSTPTITPTLTPSPTPVSLPTSSYDDFESYSIGNISVLDSGVNWAGFGYITSSFYATGSDDFESYIFGTITTLTSGSGWSGGGLVF